MYMSGTKNYGLFTDDDPKSKIIDLRKKIWGSENSNMTKIDTILSQKADSSISVSCILSAAAWSGSVAPYTQELIIEGLGADQNGNMSLSSAVTKAQLKSAIEARLSISDQTSGKLVIKADGKRPNIDIPVTVILLG